MTPTTVTIQQPRTLVFGPGCATRCADDLLARGLRRVLVVTSPSTQTLGEPIYIALRQGGADVVIWDATKPEPTVETFRQALTAARDARPDAVIGIGGGSPMDVAKLVAAFLKTTQDINDAWGIGKLAAPRSVFLACLPTTAGTGSEVSPNAVLLDESAKLKKAVISPHLVPDAAYVDPALTLSVPRAITAATGMDALTHCIEAYANRFAHPLVDTFALEGIRLISRNLLRAVEHPTDLSARTAVAMGSLYGGMCLGPVNTGAVHALSYPLGSEFHVAHGVSNAVLLPHVLEFNLSAAPKRYAEIATALGATPTNDDLETARRGLELVRQLSAQVGIPAHMADLGVPADAVVRMASAAMTVTRLLERNVRTLTLEDAATIYRRAM